MSRNIVFAPGKFYHLYNRGTEKRNIFTTTADHERFLSLLHLCNGTDVVHVSNYQGSTLPQLLQIAVKEVLVDLAAYCLMPNHFHLLVKERSEGGISKFMQKLTTAYTMYFNLRHERSGTLLQGKFKAQHVEKDRYLKYLVSYIHLNPVKLIDPGWKENGITNKKRAEKFLDEYRYSSYQDYKGERRPENVIVDRAALPEYFEAPQLFKQSVTEWLDFHATN